MKVCKFLVLLLIVVISAGLFIGCGDDDEDTKGQDGLTDVAALSFLTDAEKRTLCENLTENAPAACWQEDNVFFKKTADSDITVCLSMLESFNGEALVGEVKTCLMSVDDICDLAGSPLCDSVVSENVYL